MTNKDVIYFSVNNWFCGRDFPPTKNFKKWFRNDIDQSFRSDEWCKENKLCVYYGAIDMSTNYTVSAPREWVEKNCPELLTDDEYTYIVRRSRTEKKLFGGYKTIWEDVEYKKKYSDFVYVPEDGEETPDCDRVGDMPFREYREENFGSEYFETGWWEDEEDYEDYTDEKDEEENLI